MVRSLALWAALFLTLPLSGGLRIEFVAELGGRKIEGAEVCFYRAGEDRSPADLHLASREVRCLPADKVIEMPVGRWLYFVQHADGYVSSHPSVLTTSAGPETPDAFRQFPEAVRAAAVLDFSQLKASADEWFAAYVSNEGTDSPPTVIPIVQGEETMLVPADMTVVPLRVRKGEVVAATEPVRLSAGAVHRASFAAENRFMVAWCVFDPEGRRPGSHWGRMAAPDVTLLTGQGARKPLVPLRPGYGSDGALLLFPAPQSGRWELALEGELWAPATVTGEAGHDLAGASPRLKTHPVSALLVQWSAPAAPQNAGDDCAAPSTPGRDPEPAARLLKCESLQEDGDPRLVQRRDCQLVASGAVDAEARVARFSSVEPGVYLVELNVAPFALEAVRTKLTVGELVEQDVALQAFNVFGRVTINDSPARVRLEFAAGSGTSDASGQYYAALPKEPRDLPIRVLDCETKQLIQTYVPEKPVPANEPYDIALTRNEVQVKVVDATTNEPVAGAVVNCGVMTDLQTGAGTFLGAIEPTDAKGGTTVRYVPSGRDLLICASAGGYERACGEPFRVKARTTTTTSLALERIGTSRGRIVTPVPVEWGKIYFLTADGHTSEYANVQPDGSFVTEAVHRSPEYAVFVSNLPLAVIALPEPGNDTELALPLPAARQRTLEVRIGPRHEQRDAFVALMVGGRYVPNAAFIDHQMGRGLQTEIYGRGPLQIRDIFETGTISVILGPSPEDPILRTVGYDLFVIPAYVGTFPVNSAGKPDQLLFE